jgi:hypothetical protein
VGDPHFASQPIIQPDGTNNEKSQSKENAKIEPQPADVLRRIKSMSAAVCVHQITPLVFGE